MSFANVDLHSFGGGPRRLGVDSNTGLARLSTIHTLGGGYLSTWPALRWNGLEPDPGGSYGSTAPLETAHAACQALGREFMVHFLLDHDTFLDGTADDWLNVKTAKLQNLADATTELVTNVGMEILQIDNEQDNKWPNGVVGFAEAFRTVYAAAKAAKPNIKIMGGAVNFGNRFSGAPTPFTDGQTWTHTFLDEIDGMIDIYVLNAHHLYHFIPAMVAWVRSELDLVGLQAVPMWVGDAASAPKYQAPFSSAPDIAIFNDMLAEDPNAIAEFATHQASFMVKKYATLFGCPGVARVFIGTDEDWLSYGGPDADYRRQGLVKAVAEGGAKKAAFYSAQQLIAHVEGWYTAEQLLSPVITDPNPPGTPDGQAAVKFAFRGKGPCVVAWEEGGSSNMDLSAVWPSQSVRVIPIVTTLSVGDVPSYPAESTVASTAVPVGDVPVIVVGA